MKIMQYNKYYCFNENIMLNNQKLLQILNQKNYDVFKKILYTR